MKPSFLSRLLLASLLLVSSFTISQTAEAADLHVRCGDHKARLNTIAAALKQLPSGPATIHISGTCTENLVIQNANYLTLTGDPSATINDSSGGNSPMILISDSDHVVVQNLVISGGGQGFVCGPFSTCYFINDTFQGSSFGCLYGSGSKGWLQETTIKDVTSGPGLESRGAHVLLDPDVTIQNNAGYGLLVRFGGTVVVTTATIQGNGGSGVRVQENSIFRTSPGSGSLIITGNQGHGVDLQSASLAYLGTGTAISSNGGNGVKLNDLSFAQFVSGASISGVSLSVNCGPQNSATRGVGNVAAPAQTNCSESQ